MFYMHICLLFQKKKGFHVFISGKNVFLPNIINNNNIIVRIMKELVEKVAELYAAFEKDAKAQIENGNKAAGTRARKASLAIEKAMKEFRKVSLDAAK
jgi:Histone H1-like protein Hc1.